MDKLKKVLGFLVFPLLLWMMFSPAGEAQAATNVTNKAHFEELKITVAETGSETEAIIGKSTKEVVLKFSGKFSFPGVKVDEIKEGDYFIQKVPENLTLKDQTIDLMDTTVNPSKKMGTVEVDNANHQLKFIFNDGIKGKQNIRGDFVAQAVETMTKDKKKVTYVIPGGKTTTINYVIKTYEQSKIEGEVITKYGENHKSDAKAYFEMKINRSKTDMGNHVVKITDDMSKGAIANYIESEFNLYEVEYVTTDTNSSGLKKIIKEYKVTTVPEEYKKDSDNLALLTYTKGKRGFELLMPTNMGVKSFYLKYWVKSPADTSTITNTVQYLIDNQPQLIWKKYDNTVGTKDSVTYNLKTVKAVGATATADIAGKIKITKYDEADATVKLAGVVFEIREKTTNNLVDTVITDADGIAVSRALSNGKYIVKEKTPKPGYIANSKEFEVEMKGGEGVPLSISNKRETVDFEATKTWVGGKKTDYKEVKLGLYVHKKGQTVADSKPVSGNYTPEVTESNGVYIYKWKNQLPKYDVDGTTELIYSVRELQDQTNIPLDETETVVDGTSDYIVSYNEDKTKITNTYKPAKINVTAKKVWVGGQERVRPTFYFKLYRTPEGGAIEEVAGVEEKEVPKTNGTVEWTDLPATDEHGVKYTYSVMEVDEDGNLIVDTIDGYTPSQTAPLTITNTYSASPAKAVIEAKKKLEGRPTELQENEFEFTLTDSNGVVKDTKKNDKDGNVKFKELEFDKAGTYNYTITETNGGQTINGVTYDGRKVPVTVYVVDDGKGKLVASVMYYPITAVALPAADFSSSAPGANLVPPLAGAVTRATDIGIQTFTNTYKPANVKAPVSATKSFINKNTDKPIQLQGGEFEFALFEKNGTAPIQTTTNDAAGNIKFEDLEFNKADTYHYTIVEKNAGTTDKGITYSNKTIEVTIKVVDNGKGALEATVSYDNNDSTFENTYKAKNAKKVLEVDKKLSNRNLESDMFEFTLTDQVGNVEKAKNGADGKVKFSELTFNEAGTYTYTIKEVKAGTTENGITYDAKTVTAKVIVTDDGQGELHATVEYSSDGTANSTTFTNVYTPAKTQVPVKKVWNDGENQDGKRPTSVTVKLLADGQDTGKTLELNKENNWSGSFTDLDVNKAGKAIAYTIEEVAVADYKSEVTGDATTGYTITNSYTPGKTQVPVKKVWNDANNQDGKRPTSVTVKLLADSQDTGKTLELNKDNNWSGSFTDLDVNKAGKAIVYSVVEVTVTGYNSEVTGDPVSGFTITNNYTPETVNVKATKNWDDANNQDGKRPTKITINLLADGQKVDSKEIQAAPDGTWSVEFTKLAKYKNGKEIKYTVTEEAVAEYDSYIKDFTITNKYAPKEIDYKVTKVWNDANNQDGKRPESVTVQLFKSVDGSKPVAVEGKKLTLTAKDKTDANTWVASFTKLPQFEAGKEITYSIKEVDVPAGYEASVTGQVVTNTHNPETVVLSGTKVWKDNNNQDGKRTTSVKVQIFKGEGEKAELAQEIEVSEKTGWKFESKPLPKYENGQEIKYTVKEVAVKEYTSTVTTDKDGKYTVTNEYTPEKTSIKGRKIWKDKDNKDGIRPASITVKLLADGKETGKVATVSEATGWTYEFTELERYKDTKGTEFKYSVVEVPVKGYTSKVEGFNITNTHTPEEPTPGEPNEPQDPEPNKPKDPEPGKPGPKPQLPNTGEKASNAAVVAGLALMAVTGGLYFVSRKNK